MLDFSRFEVLTFDCYGTMIDWEAGILPVLHRILSAHGKTADDATPNSTETSNSIPKPVHSYPIEKCCVL